VIQTCSQSSV